MSDTVQGAYREDVLELAKEQYGSVPEYLWLKFPDYAVLRHADNQKWYAIIMDIPGNKLGLPGEDKIDILEIKCDPLMSGSLLGEDGILPAYHMKKGSWLSVLLDGSVDRQTVFALLQMSYQLTKSKQAKRPERTEPREWLVPANPKYYNMEHAFDENDTILWKQSSHVIVGDTIYLYAAAPYSCILYRCEAVGVDIPYSYDGDGLHIDKVMKIRLKHRFAKGQLSFQKLNAFGVTAVRGPRSIPNSLSCEIQRIIREETQT